MDALGGMLTNGLLANPLISCSLFWLDMSITDHTTPVPTPPDHISGGRSTIFVDDEPKNSLVSINITINKLNYKKTYIVSKKHVNLIIKSISGMKKLKSNINISLNKYKAKQND